jgi:hypothetical protein
VFYGESDKHQCQSAADKYAYDGFPDYCLALVAVFNHFREPRVLNVMGFTVNVKSFKLFIERFLHGFLNGVSVQGSSG